MRPAISSSLPDIIPRLEAPRELRRRRHAEGVLQHLVGLGLEVYAEVPAGAPRRRGLAPSQAQFAPRQHDVALRAVEHVAANQEAELGRVHHVELQQHG
eukprot:4943705-Lingulodinium_polyedra.AAC.1